MLHYLCFVWHRLGLEPWKILHQACPALTKGLIDRSLRSRNEHNNHRGLIEEEEEEEEIGGFECDNLTLFFLVLLLHG